MEQKEGLVCTRCSHSVRESDDFCPECGALFREHVECENHPAREAVGVCVICCEPQCKACGGYTHDLFLCNKHSTYEIYQGMARVYGASDLAQVEFAKSCLEQEGLHPLVYSRKASPIFVGSPDYTVFLASGEFDGHIVNEYKLMVPCQEVNTAELILDQLDLRG